MNKGDRVVLSRVRPRLPLYDPQRPMALSVRQPWAWLIMAGHKRIENRTWSTNHRGRLYLHASLKLHETPIAEIERRFNLKIDPSVFAFGAIIGHVDVVDVVTRSDSPWFTGPFGWVLDNAVEFARPRPHRGATGLFRVDRNALLA